MSKMAKSNKNMARLFFAVDLPQNIKDKLSIIQQQKPFLGRAVNPHNFHLTLKFLGNCDPEQTDELMDSTTIPQINPFSAFFEQLIYFTHTDIGAIAPKIIPTPLLQLRTHIVQNISQTTLPKSKEKFSYQPHITLFRDCIAPTELSEHPEAKTNIELTINNFCLMQSINNSKGVYYKTLAEWPIYQPNLKISFSGNK